MAYAVNSFAGLCLGERIKLVDIEEIKQSIRDCKDKILKSSDCFEALYESIDHIALAVSALSDGKQPLIYFATEIVQTCVSASLKLST